jgi:hypothetical protein
LNLDSQTDIIWRSPLAADGFREYRDRVALWQAGIRRLPQRPLVTFWPKGGPVWDALGKVSDGKLIFLEAKAHCGEIFSPATGASPHSFALIQKSLIEAQGHFAPDSTADWTRIGFQYANRLAFHYLFRVLNGLPTHMVFLYFTGARDVSGPGTIKGWQGAIHHLHRTLGLPPDFHPPSVHEVFLDIAPLISLATNHTQSHSRKEVMKDEPEREVPRRDQLENAGEGR